MTLGIGAAIRGGAGAVVVVDSGRLVHRVEGRLATETVADKMLFAEGDGMRVVAVHSGPSPITRHAKPLPDDFGRFDLASEHIWESLTQNLRWAKHVPLSERAVFGDQHAVITAGGRPGEPVEVIYRDSSKGPVFAPPEGGYCAIGMIRHWEPPEPPNNMAEAIAGALEVFTRTMRDAAGRGETDELRWPVNVALVSPDQPISTLIWYEPHPDCLW